MRRIGFLLSVWFWDFTTAWLASCRWKRMLVGVPFLIVGALLLGSLVAIGGVDLGWRGRVLDRQLTDALASDDWETARLVLNRQLQSVPENRDYKFALAKVLDAMNEREQAVALIRSLTFVGARESRKGAEDGKQPAKIDKTPRWKRFAGADSRAARWMVEHVYLAQEWKALSDRDKRDCLDLLHWLSENEPRNVQLKKLYADQLIRAESYREALPVLVTLIRDEPGMGLRAAIIAKSLGDEARANRYAKQSLTQFTDLVHQEPSNATRAVDLARCHIFLSQYPEAVHTIRFAISRSEQEQERQALTQFLAETVAAWAAALKSDAEQSPEEQLQILAMLQVALQHAPNNQRVLEIVVNQVLATANEEDQQVALLRESLTRGTSPGISHFIRGTAAVMKGNKEEAKMHLEIAAQTLPANDVILNNLAYVLAQQENADLDQALQISEAAISQASPATAYHLETRGQILLKMGRYVDAIPDLESALTVPTLATAAHRSLAECYQQLGDEEMSEQHRIAAEEKTASPAAP